MTRHFYAIRNLQKKRYTAPTIVLDAFVSYHRQTVYIRSECIEILAILPWLCLPTTLSNTYAYSH
jgi:hypothetical protein